MKTQNYNKKIVSSINKIYFGLIICLVVISFAVIDVSKTFAYFTDAATISGTVFETGTLKFSLNNSVDFTSTPLAKGGSVSYSTTLSNNGSLGFQYKVSTTDINGNADLCSALTLQAKLNGTEEYSGSLSNFSIAPRIYSSASIWDFTVTLPSDIADIMQDKNCTFKLTFNGWQENLSNNQGFNDVAQISGAISSGHFVTTDENSGIVINEILPNPEIKSKKDMPEGEWVELYNTGNTDVNVAGWYLTDKTSGNGNKTPIDDDHILASSPIVKAHGYLVVYMNKQIYNDKKDTVTLFNKLDIFINDYSYDADNYCDSTPKLKVKFEPNIAKVCDPIPENKSLSRIPDGGDVWEITIQTPATANISEGESDKNSEPSFRASIANDEYIAEAEESVWRDAKITPDADDEEVIKEKEEIAPEMKIDEDQDDESIADGGDTDDQSRDVGAEEEFSQSSESTDGEAEVSTMTENETKDYSEIITVTNNE